MAEFRIYHVARNAARHNSALDDALYGTPEPSPEKDWTLSNPRLYLKRIATEILKVDVAMDDLFYIMREKKLLSEEFLRDLTEKKFIDENGNRTELKMPSLAISNAHAFHSFTVRQFEYVEKLSHQLQSQAPNEINVIQSKAERQLKVLIAAYKDLAATYVRFTEYEKTCNLIAY